MSYTPDPSLSISQKGTGIEPPWSRCESGAFHESSGLSGTCLREHLLSHLDLFQWCPREQINICNLVLKQQGQLCFHFFCNH